MFSLTFTDARSGWLDVELQDGEAHGEASASYLHDGPGDLLRAVVALHNGAPTARCVWMGEQEEYVWSFTRNGSRVSLEILWFRGEPTGQPVHEVGKPVFATTCELAELVAALRAQFEALRSRYGAEGYQRRWQCAFPDTALAALGGAATGPTAAR